MREILFRLFEHKNLNREEARQVLVDIGQGNYNEHEVTAFMTVYLMRSITIEELEGFRDALLELCHPIELEASDAIDIVGTGGDGKDTFNISTLSCFIVAGAGQKVIKHGNYGASSVSGSSNVMELLGYKFKNDNGALQKELESTGICFLHAPLFHPALKTVGPIRRNLAMRTFFNMLGPLVNPARPAYQLIGVYSLEMARIYTYLMQRLGTAFTIIHSMDGYDEISLTDDTKLITASGERIVSAKELGKRMVSPEDIKGGGTAKESAEIFKTIIRGEGSWAQNAVVIANAATALHSTGRYANYEEAYQAAIHSLESGNAYACLKNLISLQ